MLKHDQVVVFVNRNEKIQANYPDEKYRFPYIAKNQPTNYGVIYVQSNDENLKEGFGQVMIQRKGILTIRS